MFILLIAVSIFVLCFDRVVNKTIFTPSIFFVVPFTGVIIIQKCWVDLNHTLPLSFEYLSTIVIFFLTFFFSSLVTTAVFDISIGKLNTKSKFEYSKKIEFFFLFSAFFSLLIFLNLCLTEVKEIGQIVQDEFQNKYSSGVNFYFRIISLIGSVYFITTAETKKDYLKAIVCILPNAITLVKGIILITVLAGLVSRVLYNSIKVKISYVLIFLIISLLLFSSVYFVEIVIWNTSEVSNYHTYSYIFNKISTYLVSGPQSFNINISNGDFYKFKDDSLAVFAPFLNILAKLNLYDVRVDSIVHTRTIVINNKVLGNIEPNINTFIGTLVITQGYAISLLVTSIIASFTTFLKCLYKRYQRTSFLIIYTLFMGGLFFSWFDYYFMQTFWIYLIIFVFILSFFEKKVLINV